MLVWLQVFFIIFFSFSAWAQPSESSAPVDPPASVESNTHEGTEAVPLLDKVGEDLKKAGHSVQSKLAETRLRRSVKDYFALANYSPLDFILPSKWGLTLGVIRNADQTWEIEYLRGSLSVPFVIEDLGGMTDERLSLIGRSYAGGNSFHFSYGISYFAFAAHLGSKFTNALAPNDVSGEWLRTEAIGVNGAIGNRWTFNKNITLGVDWISWAQPMFVTKKQNAYAYTNATQSNKDDVDKAMNLISYFPRFAVIKFQLGILF